MRSAEKVGTQEGTLMDKKRKRMVIGILVFLFIGSLAAMWQATKINLPESERCDGGNTCAMKYADRLKEMKENK